MTRDEAIKYLIKPVATSTVPSKEIEKQFQAYEMAIEALKQKPITHAHWIETYDYTGTYYITCSNPKCNLVWWLEEGNAKDNEMFYCPKCGYIMDEEVEE